MEDFRIIDKEESELKILSVLVEPRSFGAVEIKEIIDKTYPSKEKISPKTINKRLIRLCEKRYVEREGIKYKITEKGREHQARLNYKFRTEKDIAFNPKIVSGISISNSNFGLSASADQILNESQRGAFREGLKKIEEEYSKLMEDLGIGSSSCTLSVIKPEQRVKALGEDQNENLFEL